MAQISACKAANHQHSGLVTLDGKVIMMGDTYKGQLGLEPEHHAASKTIDPFELDLSFLEEGDAPLKIVCAGIHTCLLTKNGALYTFGCGSDGRLGHPEYDGFVYLYKETKPKRVENIGPLKDVACAYYHNIAI